LPHLTPVVRERFACKICQAIRFFACKIVGPITPARSAPPHEWGPDERVPLSAWAGRIEDSPGESCVFCVAQRDSLPPARSARCPPGAGTMTLRSEARSPTTLASWVRTCKDLTPGPSPRIRRGDSDRIDYGCRSVLRVLRCATRFVFLRKMPPLVRIAGPELRARCCTHKRGRRYLLGGPRCDTTAQACRTGGAWVGVLVL
jgi:hypothetical protein